MTTAIADDKYVLPVPTNASKAVVSKFAEQVADWLKFGQGKSLEVLVESIGGKIIYRSVLDSFGRADGSLYVEKKADFKIILSATTGAERNRFSIAHELGHYFLHFLHREETRPMRATRSGSDRVEWEANWFAGAFLMPEKSFRTAISNFNKDVDRVAAHFNVSRNAAIVRGKNLGMTVE